MDARSLKSELSRVFADLPPITEGAVGSEPAWPELDDILGCRWRDLRREWLVSHWNSAFGLSLEERRVVAVALTFVALSDYPDEGAARRAVLSLRPEPWPAWHSLHEENSALRAVLEPEQERVLVDASLLFAGQSRFLRAEATLALFWGWRGASDRADRAAAKIRQELRTWQRGPFEETERERLADQLTAAFVHVLPPEPQEICGSDLDLEAAEYARDFEGLDWPSVHPDLVGHHESALSFFTPEAVRYFLPAWLLASLDPTSLVDPVFQLVCGFADGVPPTDEIDWRAHSEEKYRLLDSDQREAVGAYLRWARNQPGLAEPGIDQALARFWS